MIRIGILSQSELPKPLEPMIETIFREQFRKLGSIFGSENLSLVGSVENKFSELASISTVEEGLNLELFPFEAPPELNEEDARINARIHAILEKQSKTTELDERAPETELIGFCDIMIFVFDSSSSDQNSRFGIKRELFLGRQLPEASLEKLIIQINCPQQWSPDADGEVYFEYITRAPGQLGISSEIEIPEKLIRQWANQISAIPH
jgi:hypothetical protein